jgi:hypothetical protein
MRNVAGNLRCNLMNVIWPACDAAKALTQYRTGSNNMRSAFVAVFKSTSEGMNLPDRN